MKKVKAICIAVIVALILATGISAFEMLCYGQIFWSMVTIAIGTNLVIDCIKEFVEIFIIKE